MSYTTEEKKPPVVVTGRILHETALAILIEVEGTGIWFPLSQVHNINHDPAGKYESTVTVEYWIAQRKGLAQTMNSNCNYCDVEAKCAYPYKPCDCCNYRKFVPKAPPITEAKIIKFPVKE